MPKLNRSVIPTISIIGAIPANDDMKTLARHDTALEISWAWIDPWGWTWVDDDPWGYAPFHYGRWASIDGRWGWIPGPREERPVYAPALVVFVGGGLAAGNVGWFPLAPHEVYVPSYRVSQGYVNRVNLTNTNVNTTTITNVYNTT